MGISRGGLLVIVSVLFFIALLVGSTLLTFSLSLKYENVNSEITEIVNETIKNLK